MLLALKTILIDFVSDSDIPNNFSIYFNTFRHLTGPVDFHFGPKKGRNQRFWSKNGGSRSIIWIPNDLDRLYRWLGHPYWLFYGLQNIWAPYRTCEPSFPAQNGPKIGIFGQKGRLKVDNLDSKWFWSTLLVVQTSLLTFLRIPIYLGPLPDLWTLISGPKWVKKLYFWSKMAAQGR